MGQITLGDLDKTVTIREVSEALEKHLGPSAGAHEIDLGDFGYETIECDANPDVETILLELV